MKYLAPGQGSFHCSSCFQQEPVEHVDFEAAWDGPVLDGAKRVMIDDLVLCRKCIKHAAKLVGLVEAPDLVRELHETRERLAIVEADLADSDRSLSDMHKAHESLVQRRAAQGRPRKPENVRDPRPKEPQPA